MLKKFIRLYFVDDSSWSAIIGNIDNHTSFSNNCFQYTLIPDSAFEQRLIDYGYDTIQDGKVFLIFQS